MKKWLVVLSPFFFIAALFPAAFAVCGALYLKYRISPVAFILVLAGLLFLYGAVSLFSAYYDYMNDTEASSDGGRVISKGDLKPESVYRAAWAFLSLAFIACLALFVQWENPLVLVLGIAGIAGGYFYAAPPIEYKYYALGDVLIFVFMGLLLTWGVFVGITGFSEPRIIILALPTGFLMASVMHSINIRNIVSDDRLRIRTIAGSLGRDKAGRIYLFLISGAYVALALNLAVKTVPVWSSMAFLTAPLALYEFDSILRHKGFEDMDTRALKFYFIYSIILIMSFIPSVFGYSM